MRRWIIGAGLLGWGMLGMGGGCWVSPDDKPDLSPGPNLGAGGILTGAGDGSTSGTGSGSTSAGGGVDTGNGGMGGNPTTTTSSSSSGGGMLPCQEPFVGIDSNKAKAIFYPPNVSPNTSASCYVWVDFFDQNDEKKWQDADDLCVANQMHLATVTSHEERILISTFMTGNDDERTWLGGKREANTDLWTWADGQTWSIHPCSGSPCDSSVNLWFIQVDLFGDPTQPDIMNNTSACIRMRDLSEPTFFFDESCDKNFDFICKRDPG